MDKNDKMFFMDVSACRARTRFRCRFDSNYGAVHRLDWHIEVDRACNNTHYKIVCYANQYLNFCFFLHQNM